MITFQYDLRYLQAGGEQFEAYLLASELYWPVGASAPSGTPPYPQITPGALLLARQRARATAETVGQQAELNRVEQQIEATRQRWRAAGNKKAHSDLLARLKLWGNFLDEYGEKPTAHYDRYAYEVGRRVQIQLLIPEMDSLPAAATEALQGLDRRLRAFLVRGSFIWQANLAIQFPPEIFWYLYGNLREEITNL